MSLLKRWKKGGKLFLIPDQHEPGTQRPHGSGKGPKRPRRVVGYVFIPARELPDKKKR